MSHEQTMLQLLDADHSIRRATFYASPTLTSKLTRTAKPRKGARYESFILTIGGPNYAERKFIKQCQKAGEPFPVKKVQLTPWPVKRVLPAARRKRLARKA